MDQTRIEAWTQPTGYRWWYALAGLLLALGAPTGALLLRLLAGASSLAAEISANTFFYLYMLVGTSIVFASAGFMAGFRADVLSTQRDRFIELSEHDDVTGLLNSRAFWDRYRRAVEKVGRFGEPLSLLLIDVDHLKAINDRNGHRFGNKVLQHVSSAIARVKRSDDLGARWGGDEFVILMSGAKRAAAERVAEALLAAVLQEPVRTSRTERTVSVTIGVASAEGRAAESLFDRADSALYLGKCRGGKQYTMADSAEGALLQLIERR